MTRKPHLAVITFDSLSSIESSTQRLSKDVFLQVKLSASHNCNIFTSVHRVFPSHIALKQKICQLNEDANVDGILVHLPMPTNPHNPNHKEQRALCSEALKSISKEKDVDGLRFASMLENILNQMDATSAKKPLTDADLKPATDLLRQTYFYPTAATAVVELLLQNEVDMSNKTVTVLGRSGLTGGCIALFLHHLSANVYAVDANTNEIDRKSALKSSDVIVTATGVPLCVRGDDLKRGSVVIDLGCYNLNDNNICDANIPQFNKKNMKKNDVCGDVEQASAVKVASKISAVPGGVGPVSLSLLMFNVMKSAVINAEKTEIIAKKQSELPPGAPPFNAHSVTGRKMHDFEHILKHTKIHIPM